MIGGGVDALDQRAQLLDREVDRVGDRAGHVFGHRGLDGQVAVRQITHFVQEPENRFLIALVLAFALMRASASVLARDESEQHEARNGKRPEDDRRPERDHVRFPAAFETPDKLRRVGVERFTFGVDRANRLLRNAETLRV